MLKQLTLPLEYLKEMQFWKALFNHMTNGMNLNPVSPRGNELSDAL
jgi:hypothetical protein